MLLSLEDYFKINVYELYNLLIAELIINEEKAQIYVLFRLQNLRHLKHATHAIKESILLSYPAPSILQLHTILAATFKIELIFSLGQVALAVYCKYQITDKFSLNYSLLLYIGSYMAVSSNGKTNFIGKMVACW